MPYACEIQCSRCSAIRRDHPDVSALSRTTTHLPVTVLFPALCYLHAYHSVNRARAGKDSALVRLGGSLRRPIVTHSRPPRLRARRGLNHAPSAPSCSLASGSDVTCGGVWWGAG